LKTYFSTDKQELSENEVSSFWAILFTRDGFRIYSFSSLSEDVDD
jgi:hypothetical protein